MSARLPCCVLSIQEWRALMALSYETGVSIEATFPPWSTFGVAKDLIGQPDRLDDLAERDPRAKPAPAIAAREDHPTPGPTVCQTPTATEADAGAIRAIFDQEGELS